MLEHKPYEELTNDDKLYCWEIVCEMEAEYRIELQCNDWDIDVNKIKMDKNYGSALGELADWLQENAFNCTGDDISSYVDDLFVENNWYDSQFKLKGE